jgi:hypothetical protein
MMIASRTLDHLYVRGERGNTTLTYERQASRQCYTPVPQVVLSVLPHTDRGSVGTPYRA